MANVKFEYLLLDIEWNQAPKTTDIEEKRACTNRNSCSRCKVEYKKNIF